MSAATIWVVDLALSERQLDRCAAILDPSERDRAGRFLRPADRARYLASHAALRLILGEETGTAPVGIRLAAGMSGKPALACAASEPVEFNLSHSGRRALIGIARGAAVGVDVEAIRPLPDALRIARAHFAADEAAGLAALPPRAIEAAFFSLWTRKEAVVKALGTGLALPLDRFSVSLPPLPARLLRMAEPGPWTLADIEAGPGHAATLALRAPDAAICRRTLPVDWPDRLG
ncbi:4'-phosphopantetheinyl transferase superfamily protein [Methylobacterium sp. NEAU K]|uniref:4'-phosphopantetheinyl transferase family protein n=1 Tax=Methylobacterium sp. NEAU K TaxID=3064946 RepID=UPI0027360D3E|nr:4'-phosphopantetheinyl transferase superfamily protein [Methylobacterium sp. NEAU K]MDP4002328.1 4'-phosphopantetheinyl transferase superfamily protein [Methylobacterium sp. NEAU K]